MRDRRILSELQRDGRLSNAALASRVGLSESACSRRVKMLEEAGAISGYAAIVDPARLGWAATLFVRVTLESQRRESLSAFEEAVRKVPEVMECYLISGEADYLLRVVARDAADYERIHGNELTALPGVARVSSTFTLRTVRERSRLPLPQ